MAIQAWQELEHFKQVVGLTQLSDLSIENLLGAKDPVNRIELALQAELMHRLSSVGKISCPKRLTKAVIKFIGQAEKLEPETKANLENYLAQ